MNILYCSDLWWTEHYNYIIFKVYKTLGLLCRTFISKNLQTKSCHIFGALTASILFTDMGPHTIKDISLLKRVQRRVTKYINDYKFSHESRLKQLYLLPLVYTYELNYLLSFIKSLKFTTYFDTSKCI